MYREQLVYNKAEWSFRFELPQIGACAVLIG